MLYAYESGAQAERDTVFGGDGKGTKGHRSWRLSVTSNRALKEWSPLFGDALEASAAMDQLLHHAHILTMEGDSYRISSRRKNPRTTSSPTDIATP